MWVCRCRIRCGIVGFDCPSCDLCRPVPGCLSAHSLAPTRAVVWLSGHETVGQTLLFLHMHLFLHLHLLPCCQPLIDLSGLVLDVLAAGTLACWQGSPGWLAGWLAGWKLQPLLHLPRSMGASLPTEPSNRCLPVCRLCHPRPSLKPVPQKTPNPSQIWMSGQPDDFQKTSVWKCLESNRQLLSVGILRRISARPRRVTRSSTSTPSVSPPVTHYLGS